MKVSIDRQCINSFFFHRKYLRDDDRVQLARRALVYCRSVLYRKIWTAEAPKQAQHPDCYSESSDQSYFHATLRVDKAPDARQSLTTKATVIDRRAVKHGLLSENHSVHLHDAVERNQSDGLAGVLNDQQVCVERRKNTCPSSGQYLSRRIEPVRASLVV